MGKIMHFFLQRFKDTMAIHFFLITLASISKIFEIGKPKGVQPKRDIVSKKQCFSSFT